jgi:hypothetical protein
MFARILHLFRRRRAHAVPVAPAPASAAAIAARKAEIAARVREVEAEAVDDARRAGRAEAVVELNRRRCTLAVDRDVDRRRDELPINCEGPDGQVGVWV